uniref:uncharacterized protein LOC109963900 isoform X3 n=1 Tax=Monopterus albus TaxID=43700 RepID=UPI0009B35599|nr:uncharacterized protein LOC109963900 isoform X3 [Monopterus albus]
MQPSGAHKGGCSKSKMVDSLKLYLNKKNRLQPIIGLGSIIECVKAGAHNREVLYLCEVCVCRLSKADIFNHITGGLHRYNYIKAWHPHFVSEWKENADLSNLARPLMDIAKSLEGVEGHGELQLLEVREAVYQKMATHSGSDGLFRVVECRSENGQTYCFLCHCCRIRSNKMDIIGHLTSSSHLVNYLMEAHPEQVESVTDATNDCEFLQSLAKKVEKEEGRGELKVVNAPESLCILLTGKSYHWCIKMLCNEWTHTDIQNREIAVEEPSVNKTSVQGMVEKYGAGLSKRTQKMKKKKVANTVFKVSLPLTKGPLLMRRTSFINKGPPVSPVYAPSSDLDLILSAKTTTEDYDLDCDAESFTVGHTEHCTISQLQQDLYSEDSGARHVGSKRNLLVTLNQEVDGYFCDSKCQFEDITGTKDQVIYGEGNYNRLRDFQEMPNSSFNIELTNRGLQTPHEGWSPAVPHTRDWSSYYSSYGFNKGHAEDPHGSAPQSRVGTGVDERRKEMRSDATQQQSHSQYVVGSVGHHGLSGELVPDFDAARSNMHPDIRDSLSHSGNAALDPRVQFETEQRRLQAYMEFRIGHVQTAPQRYMPQPTYQAVQVDYGVMSDPNYNAASQTTQLFPYPVCSARGMSQSNAFMPPGQSAYHGAHSDYNFRATDLSGWMSSGSGGAAPSMIAYPDFNSAYFAAPYTHTTF